VIWRPPEPVDPAEWRRRAEEQLAALEAEDVPAVEASRVLHELRVHQLELEMQNEALAEARMVAEAGWERYQELYDCAPTGFFSVDATGAILELNVAGATLLGTDRESLKHRLFPSFLSGRDQARFACFLQRGLTSHEGSGSCDVSLPGGRPGVVPVRLQCAVCADGKVLNLVAMETTGLSAPGPG